MEPMRRCWFDDGINLRLKASSTGEQRHPAVARLRVKLRVAWVAESPEGGVFNDRVTMVRDVGRDALADVSTCRWIASVVGVIASVSALGVYQRWGGEIRCFLRQAMRAARDGDASSRVEVRFDLQVLNRRRVVVQSGSGVAAANSAAPRRDARPPALEEARVQQWRYEAGRGGDGLLKEQCSICLEELGGGAELAGTPCSHVFHGACLQEWLTRSSLCPLCRHNVRKRPRVGLVDVVN